MNKKVQKILKKIFEETKPITMFLYGSRARGDFDEESDYEIGIIYKKENKINRSELKEKYGFKGLNLYPFIDEEFKKNSIDTPFPKKIYLWELKKSSKILYGENFFEKIKDPKIKIVDLIEATVYETATAMAAVRSFRKKDIESAKINFRSGLFGVRVLEILKLKKFECSYQDIFDLSKQLKLDKNHNELLERIIDVKNGGKLDEKYLFKNISFLNKVVMEEVKKEYLKNGDKIIL